MDGSAELIEIRRLEDKFDKHIEDDKEFMREIRLGISDVWKTVGSKVSWTWFWTILVFCASITSGIAYLLYDEIKLMRTEQQQFFERQTEKQATMQSDVSSIKGKLEPYKIEFSQ